MPNYKKTYVSEKYSNSKHDDYYTIMDLLEKRVAIIDSNEKLKFTKGVDLIVQDEVRRYCLEKEIPYIE